ncbi:DNA polymerase III delta subunit-like protein [Ezakiella coagulans]|uniref:DNA polymerase III delta subunit-like protein n=1 Tax=Ezakiella coagulans TaxID=46507 RepID=A0A2U1DMK8_9FIRM|nr:AAA family ATPase [Ezakiella coagulans]PVY88916.1 DNA polymerase III delta subunit-like protein [Ezakiella coagulans]
MAIVGHKREREVLSGLLSRDGLSLSFSGKEGTGKKLVALSFLRELLGISESDDIIKNPDLFLIEKEDEMIKADDIRALINFSGIKSYLGGKKAVLIDNAENMNKNAQNALLKILEEPPKGEFIILITKDFEELLPTIRSRVTNIRFQDLKDEEMREIFPNITEEILSVADGSAKKADSFIHADTKVMNAFAKNVILSTGDAFLEGKEISYVNLIIYTEYTQKILSDMILERSGGEPKLALSKYLNEHYDFSIDYLIEKSRRLDKTAKLYAGNYNKKLLLANLLF